MSGTVRRCRSGTQAWPPRERGSGWRGEGASNEVVGVESRFFVNCKSRRQLCSLNWQAANSSAGFSLWAIKWRALMGGRGTCATGWTL